MYCVDHVVEGAVGRAVRFGRQHLADGFADQWVIELDESRMFWPGEGFPVLRSQLTLIVAPVELIAPGDGRPVLAVPPTHAVLLGLPQREWHVDHLDDGPAMQLETHPVGYFEGHLNDPNAARLAGLTLAGCLAHGDLPVGTRVSAAAFAAAAGAAFRAADLVTVVRVPALGPVNDGGDGTDGAAQDG